MDSQGAAANTHFDFNAMDFAGFTMPQQSFDNNATKMTSTGEDNTSPAFFFADEGIDTTSDSFGQAAFGNVLAGLDDIDFGLQQPLGLDNTSGGASWVDQSVHVNQTFPPTPTQSFDTMYTPQINTNALGKRPLQLDVQDFPQSKRHQGNDLGFSPYPLSVASSWAVDTQPTTQSTPSSSVEPVGLSDEAADVCATWFSKYNVLPSDRHIDSLSQLTGESATAIRQWFGQALKQGLGHDSAYKSLTSGFTQSQDARFHQTSQTLPEAADQITIPDLLPLSDTIQTTATTTVQGPLRGGRKGCNPTDDPELLKRDPKKIYQCTRKCGKRYGRKCDWKRNEEEGYPSKSWICSLCIEQGVERVKPCFRKYHFSQHFRNVHPGVDCNNYEEASVVHSDTAFPRKCGFCTHRFTSRQDRIDHIADHFKDGKSMLEWNDNDSNDSDNTDDDDDNNDGRPDNGDSSDDQPFFSPGKDDQFGGSGSKDGGNGGGGGSSSGYQQQPDSFFEFQLSQFNSATCSNTASDDGALLRPDKPCVPSAQHPHGNSEAASRETQRIISSPETTDKNINCRDSSEDTFVWEDTKLGERRSRQPEPIAAKDVDPTLVARDAFSKSVMKMPNLGGIDLESLSGPKIDGNGNSTVRALNALLTLLNPIPRAAPALPPPLPPSDGLGDSTNLWLGSERSFLEGLITSQNIVAKPLNTSLQQYWKGITTLLDQQSFTSIKLLGTGGFSTVDEVLHRGTSLRISRKTLKNRRQSAIDELKKEVNVLQKLRHPHVIRFLGAYSKDDKLSILLSPVAETTLAGWLDQKGLEKPSGLAETIVKMLGCLSSTLRYLHEQRPVVKHMDIKPQNILVMHGNQEFPHVVLSDFGISSIEETKLDDKHKPITRQYCAPEVSGGTQGEQAADIWSLGCVFAEMATVAFSSDNPHWHKFRSQYHGRKTSYYWQDIPALQDWFSKFFEESSSSAETTVVQTVKSMLSANPAERPDAATLTMIFTPAPCCLSWPNEQACYPGPDQEIEAAKMYADDSSPDHNHVHVDQSSVGVSETYAQVAEWLHECTTEHEACQQQQQQQPGSIKVLPTRLIDIRPDGVEGADVRILNSAQLGKKATSYAVLSHTWNETDATLTTDRIKAGRVDIPRASLSANVENGIAALQRMGYRYAWIDSLCVLQDSAQDKERECIATADVYRNADLTVMLDRPDCTSSPLQTIHTVDDGCCSSSRSTCSEVKDAWESQGAPSKMHPATAVATPTFEWGTPGFSWDTRAWSLQERLLSRRILHLNAPQVYWECNGLKASETFPRGLPPLLWEKVHTKAAAPPAGAFEEHLWNVKSSQDGPTTDNAPSSEGSCVVANGENEGSVDSAATKSLKTCQWIKKEGDGIGDSMEAAQMSITLNAANMPMVTAAQMSLALQAANVLSSQDDEASILIENRDNPSCIVPTSNPSVDDEHLSVFRHPQASPDTEGICAKHLRHDKVDAGVDPTAGTRGLLNEEDSTMR
ncbi:unnamed protein product [Periconia digitata]|uniref:Protein kinase domain-containing protein n=1 Tax=Periconia digitata TaxID=1303443 RepID=A0A9W4URW6_9PLEO|nr:unnamed protein product [Periconia digitata]